MVLNANINQRWRRRRPAGVFPVFLDSPSSPTCRDSDPGIRRLVSDHTERRGGGGISDVQEETLINNLQMVKLPAGKPDVRQPDS